MLNRRIFFFTNSNKTHLSIFSLCCITFGLFFYHSQSLFLSESSIPEKSKENLPHQNLRAYTQSKSIAIYNKLEGLRHKTLSIRNLAQFSIDHHLELRPVYNSLNSIPRYSDNYIFDLERYDSEIRNRKASNTINATLYNKNGFRFTPFLKEHLSSSRLINLYFDYYLTEVQQKEGYFIYFTAADGLDYFKTVPDQIIEVESSYASLKKKSYFSDFSPRLVQLYSQAALLSHPFHQKVIELPGYLDAFGSGYIKTIITSLYDVARSKFFGTIAIDIPMETLFSDLNDKERPKQYLSLIIDRKKNIVATSKHGLEALGFGNGINYKSVSFLNRLVLDRPLSKSNLKLNDFAPTINDYASFCDAADFKKNDQQTISVPYCISKIDDFYTLNEVGFQQNSHFLVVLSFEKQSLFQTNLLIQKIKNSFHSNSMIMIGMFFIALCLLAYPIYRFNFEIKHFNPNSQKTNEEQTKSLFFSEEWTKIQHSFQSNFNKRQKRKFFLQQQEKNIGQHKAILNNQLETYIKRIQGACDDFIELIQQVDLGALKLKLNYLNRTISKPHDSSDATKLQADFTRQHNQLGIGHNTLFFNEYNVLIIDQDKETRKLFELALIGAELRIHAFDSFTKALEHIEKENVNLIVINNSFEETRNPLTIQALKKNQSDQEVMIILIDDSFGQMEITRSLNLDINELIEKPFFESELERKLSNLKFAHILKQQFQFYVTALDQLKDFSNEKLLLSHLFESLEKHAGKVEYELYDGDKKVWEPSWRANQAKQSNFEVIGDKAHWHIRIDSSWKLLGWEKEFIENLLSLAGGVKQGEDQQALEAEDLNQRSFRVLSLIYKNKDAIEYVESFKNHIELAYRERIIKNDRVSVKKIATYLNETFVQIDRTIAVNKSMIKKVLERKNAYVVVMPSKELSVGKKFVDVVENGDLNEYFI